MFDTATPAAPTPGLSDPALWNRLRVAPLPALRGCSDFARMLANTCDLPLAEARDVEQEYRRFLYLAALSPAQPVPPTAVRLAWQLHASAPEYAAFCAGVLKKPLPLDDTTRMLGATAAYQRTRADYAREFGQAPPRLIWTEGISPRLPRWLGAHAAILGFTGAVAWDRHDPAVFGLGLGLALALYGLDLWTSQRARQRRGIGAAAHKDLAFFLRKLNR